MINTYTNHERVVLCNALDLIRQRLRHAEIAGKDRDEIYSMYKELKAIQYLLMLDSAAHAVEGPVPEPAASAVTEHLLPFAAVR